jgi:spore germination protein YaaH
MFIKRFGALIVGLIVLLGSSPLALAKTYNVSAWMPSWDNEEAYESFDSNKDVIDSLSPFWYHVEEDGTITPPKDGENLALVKYAQENGIEVIPTISNSFDGNKIKGILNDSEQKKKNIQNIIDLVRKYNYDGIDIDYEAIHSEDKDAFTAYIRDLREALNKYDKKLTIAIQAQSFAMLPIYGDRGQDWEKLHPYVDEFRIMTYDYGWRGSIPRPIAPYYWVEEVIEYAVTKVPREKIYVGVPFYGYGWSSPYFYSYTYDTILLILSKYGVDFQYDPFQKTNRLFYVSDLDTRDEKGVHEVWFENHTSLEPKLELVKKYDLGGIAIWRLGKEDVSNWYKIRKVLKEAPLGDPLYFKDVDSNTTYFNEITRLADLGIVKGQGSTKEFKPLQKVNRAEILKMALNSFARNTSEYWFEETRSEEFYNPFKDILEDQWYFPYVQTAADLEIVNGYPDGTFKPSQTIIRAEAVKIALESAGIDISPATGSSWYVPYRTWALKNGLYTSTEFKHDEEISRGEAAYIIAKVIETIE